jgi:AraC-like DNA-binding protein
MPDYLKDHTVANTRQVDEMHSTLTDVYDAKSFHVPGDRQDFYARAGYFNLGGCDLSYCSYGSAAEVEFRDDDFTRFQFAISGAAQASNGRLTADVDPGVIVCTPAAPKVTFGPSFSQLVLRINYNSIEQDLTALLGVRPKEPITFNLSTSANAGHAARLRHKIFYRATSIDLSPEPIPAQVLREIDQATRLKTLFAIPNSFSDRLNAPQKSASSWQVSQVERWIDENWAHEITIDRLAAVSGASARSIFATFKTTRGYTPMAYLKKVRLDAARDRLLLASAGETVTGIGLACGFLNLGHFAKAYQFQFGELPSDTLARSRAK